MNGFLRHPLYVGALAVVWMFLQQRISVANFLVGYLIGALVAYLCRNFWVERVWIRRPANTLRLAISFVAQVIGSNLQVARIVLSPRIAIHPTFLVLPLTVQDELTIAVLANMITLTPGTLTVDVAPDRSALYVHCLSAPDADAVRRQIIARFERPLQESIVCSPL